MGILKGIDNRLNQFGEMMARRDVGIEAGDGCALESEMRLAVVRCVLCRHAEACREWLQSDRPDYPGFCPNAEWMDRHGRPQAPGSSRRHP